MPQGTRIRLFYLPLEEKLKRFDRTAKDGNAQKCTSVHIRDVQQLKMVQIVWQSQFFLGFIYSA